MRLNGIYRYPEANFEGRRNASKVKTLIVLYHRLQLQRLNDGLTAKELSMQSGVTYSYLKLRLKKWFSPMTLVSRRSVERKKGRPELRYTISTHGISYLENTVPRGKLESYILEVKQHRAKAGVSSPWDNMPQSHTVIQTAESEREAMMKAREFNDDQGLGAG